MASDSETQFESANSNCNISDVHLSQATNHEEILGDIYPTTVEDAISPNDEIVASSQDSVVECNVDLYPSLRLDFNNVEEELKRTSASNDENNQELSPNVIESNANNNVISTSNVNAEVDLDADDLSCKICSEKFPDLETLELHEFIHKDNPFRCSNCPREFKHKFQLKQHLQKIHFIIFEEHLSEAEEDETQQRLQQSQSKKFKDQRKVFCKVCHAAVASTWNLKRHMKTHEGIRPVVPASSSRKISEQKSTTGENSNNKGAKAVKLSTSFACPYCPQEYCTYNLLFVHLLHSHRAENSQIPTLSTTEVTTL